MSSRGRAVRQRPYPLIMLLVAAIAVLASLATVLRAFAMPVEARTTTPWYSYQGALGFDWTAKVKKGLLYSDSMMKPDALHRIKLPVEPAQYRRVLVTKHTESIEVRIPYSFKGDRPADLTGTLRVDGTLVVPNIWQKPYPLLASKTLKSDGTGFEGVETITIPIAKLVSDLEALKTESNILLEPLEIHIRPVFEVGAAGLQRPVNLTVDPDFLISMLYTTINIDDTREVRQEKTLAETTVVPITVNVLGNSIKVSLLRQISLYALSGFLLLGVVLILSRRRKPDNRTLLQRLGTNMLTVRSFELPPDAAIAEVRSAKELLQIQAQTERPVIKVANTCYLLDGTTCYRLVLGESEPGDD